MINSVLESARLELCHRNVNDFLMEKVLPTTEQRRVVSSHEHYIRSVYDSSVEKLAYPNKYREMGNINKARPVTG